MKNLLPGRWDTRRSEAKKLRGLRAPLPLLIGWGEGKREGESRATIQRHQFAASHEDPSPWPSPRPTGRGNSRRHVVYRTISSVIHLAAVFCVAAQFTVRAEDWPQWRGPHFNGSSTEKGLPSKWSKEEATWSVELPGPSAATPAILGDRLFVSTPDMSAKTLHALGLDRKTGKVLWNQKTSERLQRDDRSNFASPSPVADANRVFFFYGDGTLVAFDHLGKQLWSRSITKDYGEFAFQWTFSTSPLLYEGKLYLQVLQRNVPVGGRGRKDGPNESYLLALDPASGKELWRVVRPSEAVAESLEAFTTPVPFEHSGRKEILVVGGDCLTGHDPQTGQEIWRWGTWNPTKIGHWRLVPSPAAGGGVVLACGPKSAPIYAIKAGGSGTLDDSAIAWKSPQREVTSDVTTPLFYDGDFFVVKEERPGLLFRIEPATGKVKWSRELPGRKKYETSPTGADGKVYLMNFAGDVTVVNAKDGTILHTVAMGDEGDDMTRSTIAVANGQIFIRTNKKLYCIGKS
ncbi:MAG: PQQ-binding-like beta-propeller repeat protein, partial [Verrucomicrobiales bacterium]|nr:PQQ-binding-like beta-propeller repeat protein [Verrucomicrobiales bacterium]